MIGIWIIWPGFWVEDRAGNPRAWDTEAEARAWAEENDYLEDAIEFREL